MGNLDKKIRIFVFLIIYLLVFSLIYYFIGNFNDTAHFKNKSSNQKIDNISFWECFYFTVITQSTIGYGRIQPRTRISEFFVVIQAIGTILFVIQQDMF